MLKELISARGLPPLMRMNDGAPVNSAEDWEKRRAEILDIYHREVYGVTPPAPDHVDACLMPYTDYEAFGHKACQEVIHLSFMTPKGRFWFPITLIRPYAVEKAPVFVYPAFRRDIPDKYLPAEEIIDRGFAIATFLYTDVTSESPFKDDPQPGDSIDGLQKMYPMEGGAAWGKIGVWAFAASRVLDYLETRGDIDASRACVIGHSRLGKTALWCGAQDQRFTMVVSNESGCAGAALYRDKIGEVIGDVFFPGWFCPNYMNWCDKEHDMPFDQHMLLSLIAPRQLYVSSAEEDKWADPESEFLACAAASPAWEIHGKPGLVTPDNLPAVNAPLAKGGIAYHVRAGSHFHSRTDWNWVMDCMDRSIRGTVVNQGDGSLIDTNA